MKPAVTRREHDGRHRRSKRTAVGQKRLLTRPLPTSPSTGSVLYEITCSIARSIGRTGGRTDGAADVAIVAQAT